MQPTSVMEGESALVTLVGAGFVESPLFRCRFGNDVVAPTRFVRPDTVVCKVPPQSPGITSVQISVNGQDLASDTLNLAVHDTVIVDCIEPSFGFLGAATVIQIAMKNISRDVQLECYFSELDVTVRGSSLNGSTRECVAPKVLRDYGISVSVQIRESNQGKMLLEAPFRYYRLPEITDVFPSVILETGKTLVYVRGQDFPETIEMACQFGVSTYRVLAVRLNSTTIVCMTPPHRPKQVQLRVCFGELQCTPSFVWFQYHLFPTVKSLTPSSAHQYERTVVQINGYGFFNASSLACRFGKSSVTAASFQSDSLVECVAPALSRGCVRFDLVVDGQIQATSRGLEFCFLRRLFVSSILPANGPAKGGTRVLVQGGAFVKSATYSCGFGNQATAAEFMTDSQLSCVSPPGSLRTVLFSVSEAGMPPTISDVTFRYAEMPSISSLSPARGSEVGMYRLLITGSGFICSPALQCRFGAKDVVPALWISENAVSCVAPRHEPGFVNVFVANNLINYSEDVSVFQYLASPILLSFELSVMERVNNTSLLTIQGREFRNSSGLRCLIGDDLSIATFDSDSVIHCEVQQQTRTSAAVGLVDLSVAMSPVFAPDIMTVTKFEGLQWSPPIVGNQRLQSTVKTSFSALRSGFIERASVNAISPSSGPLSETTLVRLSGSNFVASPESACVFGRQRVLAIVHNSTDVTCIVFANMWATAGAKSVGFSSSVQDRARDELIFFFYDSPSVISLSPLYGSVDGGTQLTFSFAQRGPEHFMERVICIIGDEIVDGSLVAPGKITCAASAAVANSKSIRTQISFNGQHFMDSPPFRYIDEPQFKTLVPSSCHEKCNQRVQVRGSNFSRVLEMWCRFGSSNPSRAQWVSTEEVVCRAPSHFPGTVEFTFSMNGVDFKETGLTFAYSAYDASFEYAPVAGPSTGGTVLTVEDFGSITRSCQSLVCLFGLVPILPSATMNSSVQCVSPPIEDSEDVIVSLSCDDEIVVKLEPAFHYYALPAISEVLPRAIMLHAMTHLTLRGSQFDGTALMQCRFDGQFVTEALYVDSSEIRCPVPQVEWPVSSFISVDLTLNGVDFSSVRSNVPVIASLEVFGLSPTHAIIGHPIEVTVQVSDLLHSDELLCRIGESYATSGRVITRTAMACTIPIISSPGKVRLSVSTNGVDFTESGELELTYHVLPSVSSLQRSVGSMQGREIVIIKGQSFFDGGSYFCQFGDDENDHKLTVQAMYLSSTELSCAVPAWKRKGEIDMLSSASTVSVHVGLLSGDDKVYLQPSADSLAWTYFSELKGLVVSPSVVFTNEWTAVAIAGFKQQIPQHAVECVIRDQHGEALYSPQAMAMASSGPELTMLVNISTPGSYLVELRSGGYLLNSEPLVLQIKSKLEIVDVTPRSGPLRGGTIVYVRVQGLSPLVESMLCVFSNQSTPAVALNESSLWCTSPRGDMPGAISLSVALSNGPQAEAPRGFKYLPDEKISEVRPTQISSFLRASVVVTGTNFHNGSGLSSTCRIGSIVTSAIVRSSTEVICESVYLDEGTYSLSVACDGSNYAASNASIVVTARMRIIAVSPDRSPSFGGGPVSVFGRGLEVDSAPKCVFGDHGLVTIGFVHSSTWISCPVPDVNVTAMLPLLITANDSETNSVLLRFEAPLLLIAVNPSFGFAVGGMSVSITVTGASNDAKLWCNFGKERTLARWISSARLECTTPQHAPGQSRLSISGTHQSVEGSELRFGFVPEMSVVSSTPITGSVAGGTNVLVTLSRPVDSVNMSNAVCAFGSVLSKADLADPRTIVCVAPPMTKQEREVSIKLSLNGNEFVTSPSAFYYHDRQTISSVSPTMGSVRGGVLLTVGISEVTPSSSYVCAFSRNGTQSFALARVKSEIELECAAIALPKPLDLELSIWMKGEPFSTNSVAFHIVELPTIKFFSPAMAPESGGALVRVVGDHFPVYASPLCRFGESKLIRATVITATLLECETPPMPPGNYSVGVTWNEQEYSYAPQELLVYQAISVTLISPTRGPRDQAIEVAVYGSGFSSTSTMACRFDRVVAAATFVSRNEIVCLAPVLASQISRREANSSYPAVGLVVKVEVTMDGVRFFSHASAEFRYDTSPKMTSIYPQSGGTDGGTVLLIDGFFDEELDYECLFDHDVVPAQETSATLLRCVVPQVLHPRVSTLGVRIKSDQSIPPFSGFTFEHTEPPTVKKISPLSASSAGGDEIIVMGENFASTESLRCRFGDKITASKQAVFVSNTTVVCVAPNHPSGFVTLEVSLNGVDFTPNQQVLYFFDSLGVVEVFPSVLPASGGAKISVKAVRIDQESVYECLFVRGGQTLTRPAYALNETDVICYSPQWAPGDARVGILVDGKAQLLSEQVVSFVNEPRIRSILPLHGPISGGTVVKIQGDHLSDSSIQCVFGDSSIIAPSSVTDTQVECMVPSGATTGAQSEMLTEKVDVRLQIQESVVSNTVSFAYDQLIAIHSVTRDHVSEQNGTVLLIEGSSIVNTPELGCSVGGSIPVGATFLDSAHVLCHVPAAAMWHTSHSIGISLNNQDFVSFDLPASAMPSVTLSSISPLSGSIEGGSKVVIQLSGGRLLTTDLQQSVTFFCTFGDDKAPAVLDETQSTVRCFTPAVRIPSRVPVNVVWRVGGLREQFSAAQPQEPLQFEYEVALQLLSLSPTIGNSFEPTTLSISGSGFRDGVSVRFGVGANATYADADVRSSSKLVVSVPINEIEAKGGGPVSVSISTNSVDFSNSLVFVYESRVVVLAVTPRHIFRNRFAGADQVKLLISGANFDELATTTLQCRIGSAAPANVTWLSTSQLLCYPPELPVGVYSVAISTNGRDFTSEQLEIVYHDNFILNDVSPPFGSVWGKTQVTLSGARFDTINNTTDVICVFGTTQSELVTIDATTATCESPSYTIGDDNGGVVEFAIGYRGGSDIEDSLSVQIHNISSIWSFEYVKMPTIDSVHPQFIMGNELQVLRVSGSGFKDTALLACSIGGVQIRATYLTSTLLECEMSNLSKSSLLSGVYSVEIANNGQEFTNSEVEIVPMDSLVVLSVEPAQGLINRPVAVKIRGENFSPLLQLQCLVGESYVVNATFLSELWIECVLPASSHPLVVQLAISANGIQFISVPTPFSYEDAIVVYSIYPPTGPLRGGTAVVVTGEGFVSDDGKALYCRFGSLFVPAQVVSAIEIKCLSPPHRPTSPEVVTVAVTKQNSHLPQAASELISETGVVFAYRLLPSVISIDPPMGTTAGGTVVQVKASNVDQLVSIWCRFGDIIVKSDTNIGEESDSVVCTSPPAAKQGRVFLEISTNQVDFSESFVPFYFETRASATELSPRYGKTSGGTRTIISGRNFNNTGTLECAFGSTRVPAKWLSSQSLECVTPAGFATKEVQRVSVTSRSAQNEVQRVSISGSSLTGSFRLSLAGVFTSDISVLATPADIALAITPILPRGSVQVRSVLGLAFTWTVEFLAFEGSLKLLGYDASKLTGATAAITVMRGQVGVPTTTGYVSLLFGNKSTSRIPLSSSGPAVLQILGSIQPLAAFQSVQVTSQAVTASGKQYTQVNWDITFELPALDLSTRGILCNLPLFQPEVTHILGDEVTAAVTRLSSPCVAVSVYLNRQDTAQGQLQFAYMNIPSVVSVTPALGSASGGTNVTISGQNFVSGPDLMCVFGKIRSPAIFASPAEVRCQSPPHNASTVFVKLCAGSIERPNHDLLSETIALFQYHEETEFESFAPSHGPNTGGTQLKIKGSGFLDIATLACRLQITLPQQRDPVQVVIKATFASRELISCQMPSLAAYFVASNPSWTSSASATASIEVSINGADFVVIGSTYTFIPVILTTGIKPVTGPINGGTPVIVQMERSMRNISHCKFGNALPVVTTSVSSRAVSCTSPLIPGGQGLSVQVALSSNGVDFSASTQTFTYTAPLEISSVAPTVGPTAGGTRVTFALTISFVYNAIYCRFGQQIVQGTIASATTVACSAPPSDAQRVGVDLSINGIDFDIQAGEFDYVSDPSSQFQLTPLNGFTSGGTLVSISGPTAFVPERSYSCKFDDKVVVAEFANTTHVGCRTPPVATPRRVTVRITDNSLDFTMFNLSFVYDAPLYVTSISPFGGDLEGRQLVSVNGGDFNSGAQGLFCRFGDQVVDATVRSPTSATCVSPQLKQIREVQQLRIASATLVPGVQRVSISAAPLVPTVQEVKITADPLLSEIQEFRVYCDSVSEVQSVTVSAQAYSGETISIQTGIQPLVQEVQAIQMHSSSFIGGSFRLILEDQATTTLTSYAAPSELKSALEALSNVGQVTVAKTTKDAEGSCFWVITFLDRAGDVPMLRVHNLTLMDSGSQDLVIQVSELMKGQGAMLIGSFQLAIDGQVSAAIAYDASEAQLAQALSSAVGATGVMKVTRTGPFLNKVYEWLVTFDGLPNRVRAVTAIKTELSGGTGLVTITTISPGAKSEQQQITTTLTSGAFVCSLLGKTSQSIAFDATPAAVISAFDPVLFGRIGVTGVQGGPWTIAFLDWAGNLPLLSCGAQQTVVEIAPGTGAALSGSFRLSFGSETTSALPVASSESAVESALEALNAITDVTVSTSTRDFNGGATWLITFLPSDGDVSILVADGSSLQGTVPRVVTSEVHQGNTVDGVLYFALSTSTSRQFALRASAAELQQALGDVLPVSSLVAQVSTSTSLPGRGVIFTITFATSAGNVEQLTLKCGTLSGAGAKVESKTLQNGSQTIGGSFVLEYEGVRTPSLPWNVSADDLQYALQFMKSIPGDGDGVQVTRSGPDALNGGMSWRITFPLNLAHPGNLVKPIYSTLTLTGSNAKMQVAILVLETPRLSGTIQLSFGGSTSALIDISKGEKDIELILEALPNIGDLQVVKQSSVGTNNQVLVDIRFLSMRHVVTTPPLFTVATQTLTGTSPSVSVQQLKPGAHNEIQKLSIYSALVQPTITFQITWNGKTAASTATSTLTALEMQAIVASIPGTGSVVVERIASSTDLGFTWFILFSDLSSTSPNVMTIQVTSALPAGLMVDILRSSSNLSPLAGTFALGIGEVCTELTLGNYCKSAQTSLMSVSVNRATLEHELSLLPNLDGVTVSQQVSVADWNYQWLITFPFGFGDVPLLTISSSSLLGSGVNTSVKRLQKGTGLTGAQVALEVSSNNQDFSSSGVVFRYSLTPDVLKLIPDHGPQRGETEVVVVGINFANTSSLSCRFGGGGGENEEEDIVQAARFINSTHLTCISPAAHKVGDVLLEISNYGAFRDASFTTSNKIFSFDKELVIETVTPSLGPVTGNFSVALMGGPFRKTDATRCRFAEVVVIATWISFDEIRCMAPPHIQGVFALHVTQNDQDYLDTNFPFFYYVEQGIHRISPVFGPASIAGTSVIVEGSGFVNSTLLSCRFGFVVSPGEYVSPKLMKCVSPPMSQFSGGLQSVPLSEHRNALPDPSHGSVYLFPEAYYYPQYWSRLVSLEVSNNRQDFTLSGVNFLYYQDATLSAIYPSSAYDIPELAVFAKGANFINSTSLTCRMGLQTFQATFVTSQLLLCIVKQVMVYQDSRRDARIKAGRHALFDISNNGKDFTSAHVVFEFLGSCPSGFYCPQALAGKSAKCPRGSFCPGQGNRNFTLCPRGTYQPQMTQAACLRCPVGYHCPHMGMHVPRLCPAGFICDVTGIEDAEQPCPEGHFCLEGTATTSTTCSPLARTGILVASTTEGEGPVTLRRRPNREFLQAAIGTRRSGCWNNETSDFGLQVNKHPSRFWMELRKLPLAPGAVFAPIRGRFCLDDSCLRLADADNYLTQDENFDYASTSFALRRPVPCPKGTYCHSGTAGNDMTMKNFTTPQPCFESMYCPEGSLSPLGYGECAVGFYCPFGTRIPCPAGTYCPQLGHSAPISCPPGMFNAMVAQANCTTCPVGFICPGFNRLMPVLCPAGYVCSKRGLSSPNSLCPKGFYCLEGTATSDGFRNDTRLRPYPCKPGTYCLKGVVADKVRVGDYRYAQNCTEGFYCELGSSSPKGSGLCPPGFICPSGTAAPIPTDVGKFAELEGTVSAADCAPGYYAPTIESTTCIPCPPGTSCENDGTAVATVCGPGSYRGSLNADGISCLACPQGTWSKNWEIRGVEECIKCAPGMVCPIDGITYPCTSDDLPHVFVPLLENLSIAECLDKGNAYYFGVLLEPWIDDLGRGPHFLPSRDGKCYENFQPRGSVLYQRLADFHGPMYELESGVPHQGYGDVDQYPPPNIFDRGSLVLDLQLSQMYDVARNCTQGFFHRDQWFPGTCEADIFCSATSASSEEFIAQAQPCPEGYVCDLETSAEKAFAHYCPGGYVCGPGTTPDLSIESPRGQLNQLCPATKFCAEGTAESQKEQSECPAGYFCPTGTMDPYLGLIANDAIRRRLTRDEADPFLGVSYTKYIADGDIRIVSAHDMRCFNGIDNDLEAIFHQKTRASDSKRVVVNRAVEHDVKCARDHKWRHVELAIRRNDCDCASQVQVVQRVFQLWKCTATPSVADPTIFDPNLYGWKTMHLAKRVCRFNSTSNGGIIDLSQQINGSGVNFQVTWTNSTSVRSYAALKALVLPQYQAQVNQVPLALTSVDPFLYDLNHAINIVEHFGEETPNMVGYVSSTSNEILRLDTCACQKLFKCPNGTTSAIGSGDIYDCVKTGSEILQRLTPIPSNHPRLVSGTEDYRALSGTNKSIGSIVLQPLEVATITINTTQLSTNITYKDHYQLSVYTNCKPCPPRYKCDLNNIPPLCTYPNNDNTTATQLYDACMKEKKDDAGFCQKMPFFCEKRSLLFTDATGASLKTVLPGCCSCERREMPQFFEDTTQDLGFPDNKHGYLQFSIAAVERTELTITLELLHGLYVQDFEDGFTDDRFDLQVFTPSRADYAPTTPSTNAFFAVIAQESYDDLMLPLNLPESHRRIPGTLTYEYAVEERVFIDRESDIMVGDPTLPAKHGFIRNKLQNTLGLLLVDSSSNTTTKANKKPVVPPTEYFGLYPILDPRENVEYSDTWWTQKLEGSNFIALSYFPFFSSCRGFDSHMWIAKLLESHPDCDYVSYNETVEVNQYPWKKKTVPNADKCVIDYTIESSSSSNSVIQSLQRGINLSCTYEENLEGGTEKPRWYEASTDTTLFYMTKDPASADDFVGQTESSNPLWGRSDTFQSFLGTDNLIAVKVGKSPGLLLAVPQEVYLNLTYYQMTPGKKRLVEAEVNFGQLCTVSRSSDIIAKMAKKGIDPCIISKRTKKLASSDYNLLVSWEPLDWFALMNLFQFTVDVYLVFFTLVGFLSIIQGVRTFVV